jgi:preprotein translocase subunit YajC
MISDLLDIVAMSAPPTQPGEAPNPMKQMMGMFGPLILIFAVFYLILIRPQQKQQKELQKMLDALKVGDRVLLNNGIFGIISQIKEKTVLVKIAENTKIEMLRSGVQQVVRDEPKETK